MTYLTWPFCTAADRVSLFIPAECPVGTAGESQRSSLGKVNEEDSEDSFRDPDGVRRKERNDTDETRDKAVPCQGGGFHEIPDQDERPAKNKRKHDLFSNERICYKEKDNKRVDCAKTFIQKLSVVSQEQICSREKLCNCSECGKSFGHQTTLSSHQRTHSGEKLYKSLFDSVLMYV